MTTDTIQDKAVKDKIEKRSYLRYELETIIRFDQDSPMASVYTHEKTWQNYIEKVMGIKPVNVWGAAREYEIPKKFIRMPNAPRIASPKQREVLARARKVARASNNGLKGLKPSIPTGI